MKTIFKKFNKEKNYYNFINKSYFIELCKKNNLKLKIFSLLPNSRQKYYRYSVLIKKKVKI